MNILEVAERLRDKAEEIAKEKGITVQEAYFEALEELKEFKNKTMKDLENMWKITIEALEKIPITELEKLKEIERNRGE